MIKKMALASLGRDLSLAEEIEKAHVDSIIKIHAALTQEDIQPCGRLVVLSPCLEEAETANYSYLQPCCEGVSQQQANYTVVAISGNGSVTVAGDNDGRVYTAKGSGELTCVLDMDLKDWRALAINNDGSIIVADMRTRGPSTCLMVTATRGLGRWCFPARESG
jgi:hypothetical protein